MGDVVHLPIEVTCFQCEHYEFRYLGPGHCRLFDQAIDSEIYAARDCNGFQRN